MYEMKVNYFDSYVIKTHCNLRRFKKKKKKKKG